MAATVVCIEVTPGVAGIGVGIGISGVVVVGIGVVGINSPPPLVLPPKVAEDGVVVGWEQSFGQLSYVSVPLQIPSPQ